MAKLRHAELCKRWAEKNPEKRKAIRQKSHLKLTYNLSVDVLEAMIDAQDSQCAVCQQPFVGTPCVDHDHGCCPGFKSCGDCIRDLLCNQCNAGLGQFKDDATRLQAAVDYLTRWAA